MKLVWIYALCSRYFLMNYSLSLKSSDGLSTSVSYFDDRILLRCFFTFSFQASDFFYFFSTIFSRKLVVLNSRRGFEPKWRNLYRRTIWVGR